MIEIALIVAAAVVSLSEFWADMVKFLKDTVRKAKAAIKGILYGTKVFLQKMGSAVKEIARHYSKVGSQWQETTYTRPVSASKVPPDILEAAKRAERQNGAVEITQELEMQLSA